MKFSKICLILNPIAGSGVWQKVLGKIRRGIKKLGFDLEVVKTKAKGHAEKVVQNLSEDYAVVTLGGDGTINEVINGIGNRKIPLAIFPGGTGNVLCKELGIPEDPEQFLSILQHGEIREIDLGDSSLGRKFHSFVGAGLDGHIVREVSKQRKGKMKQWHYVLPILKAIRTYRPSRIAVKIDGKLVTEEATTVIVGNVKSYGGPFEVTSRALPHDGLLDVCFVTKTGALAWLRYLYGMMRKKLYQYPDVYYYRGKEIELFSEEETPVQIDGDFAGYLPMKIRVMPRRTALLVPA